MTKQLLPFPDRSKEIYACDVVWCYFPLTGVLQKSNTILPLKEPTKKENKMETLEFLPRKSRSMEERV